MLRHTSVLVSLIGLVDCLPWPPEPPKRRRGHPKTYSDRLIVKALVIMIIRRLYTAYALLAFLDQDDPLPSSCIPCCGNWLLSKPPDVEASAPHFRRACPG